MQGVSYVMTFYVDACALVYFQFHPQSVGGSVDLSIPALRLGTFYKNSGDLVIMIRSQIVDSQTLYY